MVSSCKALSQVSFFFSRFIFVNYNAWHYVGCDTLWAGIVTTLAEKIEEEFGVLTTRLFRSIALDKLPMPECEMRNKTLLVEIREKRNENFDTVAEELTKYCKKRSISCQRLSVWEQKKKRHVKTDNKSTYWVLEFTNSYEAHNVFKKLRRYCNLTVSFPLQLRSHTEVDERAKQDYSCECCHQQKGNEIRTCNLFLISSFFLLLIATIIFLAIYVPSNQVNVSKNN